MTDILVVEDNIEMGTLLCDFLKAEGYSVNHCTDGESALSAFESGARLVVLDVMLPNLDGFGVCKKIRETSNAPIIIVSAKTEKDDKLNGLILGADDYIEKPYDIEILLAKIKGIFARRYNSDVLSDGFLKIDRSKRTACKGDDLLDLTQKEFDLLSLLVENTGKTLSKDFLFNKIWGFDSFSEPQTLTVHIKWLRQKIEANPKKPEHIVNGLGSRLPLREVKMKSYIKLLIAVVAVLAAVFVGSNIVLNNTNEDGGGRPYRVEAERIALKIKNGEDYNLGDYKYIKSVEKQSDEFESGDSDYLVKQIGGTLYRFDYSYHSDNSKAIGMFNICFIVLSAVLIAVLVLVYFRVIRPFRTISDYPTELAKGNLTMPLKQGRGGYFGKFLWGLDLLREKLEAQKKSELELKKKNKSLVLSLSHDIKTPLGVIELYSKALEKGLYKEEEKKKQIAQSINEKCDDIKSYVDGIIKASNDEIINEEVNLTEFDLSELIPQCESFYADKLRLLKIDFEISSYSDCMLSGDPDRALEVLQNLIENAIKYGDGKKISISFDREDECQLVSVHNGGCTLSDSELPHIFDSFWRGSNVGSNSGSGLGLYICRQLMRKMNGDIFAEIKDNEMIVTAVFLLA